ncbi:basement membrane-specific heparan sulfate proteoglycan core protein [Anguilla rostrata]|uniref:basement membrane-specific heparan sulfate proteoglycan core protein n=1 Tax=Anguilla rostrata TaxID=7938 RepID=UPI0030D319FD
MNSISADRPQTVIVTDPTAKVMFTGETVSLACDIRKGSGWRYSWSRNTQGRLESLYARATESQQKHILHSVRESDSGEYLCQGERGQNPVIQSFPGTLVLNVSGEKPWPVITQNPPSGEIYTGERVTLSCGFGGDPADWEYLWYKDILRHTVPNTDSSRTDGSSFTISSAALAHSGEYRCGAARGRKPFYSVYSDPLTLEISEVFPAETVTLRCVIQGSSTDWMYKWYRDGQELPVDKADSSSVNGDTYTILSADQSHSGLYTCRGELTRRASVHSLIGSSATLSVRGGKPKHVLTQNAPSRVMYTGERVTLSCGFGGDPAGWEYLWYKDPLRHTVPNTDNSRTNGSSFTISSVALAHSGEYRCRAARGRKPFYSDYSDPLTLEISEIKRLNNISSMISISADRPQAVIVTDPPAAVMFTGETVSLACDIRKGSGWRYSWSRNTQGRVESLYARATESQQKHILHSVRESDSGGYLCQGERGQNPVIQSFPGSLVLHVFGGKPRPVITQNPPSGELYTGERVTLSCGIGGDPAGWEYLWYKDTLRHTVPNTDSSRTDGSNFTISSAALAHSGEYRCRAARGRKPFYSDYSDPLTLELSGEND